MAQIVNKSGIVITQDGERLFGMDAEHYKKMESKRDPEWDKKVLKWIESVLQESLPSDDLHICLKNGIVLIRLLNTIKPGTVGRYNKSRLVPLLEMDNIHLYLKGCWQLGVPSECMFTSMELHKRRDMAKVARNIEALSKIAPNFGVTVAPLDSSQRSRPSMVKLVEQKEDETKKVDRAAKIVELREKLKSVRSESESLEGDEERLKEEIRATKREWREEKTRLTYEVSSAEKRLKKMEESENPIPQKSDSLTSTRKKTSIMPNKPQMMQRTASVVMNDKMRQHAETVKKEALEALQKEKQERAAVEKRRDELLSEESGLEKEIAELKKKIEALARVTVATSPRTPSNPENKTVEPDTPTTTTPPPRRAAPRLPMPKQSASKRYTQLLSPNKEESNYFFYETDITSQEMVNYLTKQLDRLFQNQSVSFEDLFKLQSLFETDEGRRVFCFSLFQKVRAKKRSTSKDRLIVLSSDSFDLILWLINTVLQSMKANEDNQDFFAARVLMKYSSKIVREVQVQSSGSRLRSPRRELESVQKFIRSDPLWRALSFWQELFYGDMNKKLAKKFDKSQDSSSSFTGREKKFVMKFTEAFMKTMGVDWELPRVLQENFVYSISENLGLTVGEQEKALKWIVAIDDKTDDASSSLSLSSSGTIETLRGSKKTQLASSQTLKAQTTQQKMIQNFTLKQKREVFGAPLRPYKNLLTMFNETQSLNADDAEKILPTPIWEVILELESNETCLNCPGIFRQSGDKESLQLLRAKIEANEPVEWSSLDPHEIAGLLKLWVRELQEPLTTFDMYSIVLTANEMEGEQKVLFMKKVFAKIPDSNKIALKRLLLLLRKYASYPANKMTEKNLAVVFAPALFRERVPDSKNMADVPKYVLVTQYLIENVETLL